MADAAIVPSVLAGDARFAALAELACRLGMPRADADPAMQGRFDATELLVYLVDSVKEELLPQLAQQFHLGNDEGWLLARNARQRRELIKRAIELHRYKGTRWAMSEVFRVLGVQVELTEWWQKKPTAQAHTFDLTAWVNDNLMPGEPVLNAELYRRLRRMVDQVKPARSAYRFRLGAAFDQPLRLAGALQGRALRRVEAACEPPPAKPLFATLRLAGAIQPLAVVRANMEVNR
ncbi:phage tail protein I [Chromobacterium amazonense]|uniref:Phage tail protein I n=1 Tax=Chromobacterium amazonense TaxID=1382803 RepID=A0A2S9X9W1_9NEIS|nr:phage tail protein I [Chromobacterium amazonense]PRP72446.1 phage tail protein I [Chromobacterium amazonense]